LKADYFVSEPYVKRGARMSRSKIVIFASSRAKGDTWNLAERVFSDIDHEFVDLANLSFSEFDYEHKNCDDDFLPLM